MRRRPLGGAIHPQLLLLVLACLLGLDACWRGDLPALATGTTESSDAAVGQGPDPALSPIDASDNALVITQLSSGDAGQGTGEIALSVSMPIDTATGEVVPIGSVTIELAASDSGTARSLMVELGQPRQRIRVEFDDIPAGGPYLLQASATAGGIACATSTLPFPVSQSQTVGVFLALVCGGDGGWSATL